MKNAIKITEYRGEKHTFMNWNKNPSVTDPYLVKRYFFTVRNVEYYMLNIYTKIIN